MKVYVIVKSGLQENGDFTLATTEKVFQDKAKAEAYMASNPVIWQETMNNVKFYCERAIFETELE